MTNPYLNPTAHEFLASRARWLRVHPITTVDGAHAVAVVVDGFYSNAEHAEQMAEHFRELLADVLRNEGISAPLIAARNL